MPTALNLRSDAKIVAADKRRGHRFQPPAAVLGKVPKLYMTEDVPLDEKILHLHYFASSADWYIAELDPETYLAFGWADLGFGMGEWGYIDLVELAVVEAGLIRAVERDCYFTPGTLAEVKR
jgi:hypothetical protein